MKKGDAGRILTGLGIGLVLGLAAYFIAPHVAGMEAWVAWAVKEVIAPVGSLFLRIIFMIVIPLIFSAIVLGVMEMGDVRQLGRMGLRCLAATVVLSAISVVIGIGITAAVKPGRFMSETQRESLAAQSAPGDVEKFVGAGSEKRTVADVLLSYLPRNPLEEAVHAFNPKPGSGGLIAFMVFSVFIGVALTVSDREKSQPLSELAGAMFEVSMRVIGFAMKLAPLGVACLMFSAVAVKGLQVLGGLGAYAAVVLAGLAIHMFGTYSVALRLFGGKSPWAFFKEASEAIFTAFSTSSSNATLPVSLRVAETRLKLPPRIGRFVLTVGASANQNGTALYEGVTVLFLAQVAGVDLSLGQQVTVALMCIMAGIGTAGVPGGSLPLVVGVLVTIGVAPESIAIVLGIDRILDMCRTSLNVAGDLVIAQIVARGEPAEEVAA